jgi:phosphoribosylglycinamide formyltransferase-1
VQNKLGVLISGRGTNLKALIDGANSGVFDAQISCVISNKKNAPGLNFAKENSIPNFTVEKNNMENDIHSILIKHDVNLICLAGFMKILTPDFTAKWQNRIINIHPSLLPSFKGLNAQEQALKSGVKITGCTVHFVTPELDSGAIIIQGAVPVLHNDNVDSLSNRILIMEHKCYPLAVKKVLSNQLEKDYIISC